MTTQKTTTEISLKIAIKCANGLKAGTKNKAMVTELTTSAVMAHLSGVGVVDTVGISGADFILALWGALEDNKEALAVYRAQLNRISKKVRKENGDKNPLALTVKDGKLVDVIPRTAKGGSGDGDGDGESAETSAPDTAIDPAIKLAFEVLSRMIKKEKDEKQLDALKTAVAVLAAKL